ncbi:MAG: hypothetical protein R6W73_06545 [Candidatus Saliniplasma sp.]
MPKKGNDIGSYILIIITVLVSLSIAGINLLTMFGFIRSPDLLTYSVYIGLILVPVVIIGAALNKIIIEQKKVFEGLMGQSSDDSLKLGLKINLKKKETIMADTKLHPAFYFKIAVAAILSVLTGIFTLIVTAEGIRGDIFSIYPMLIPLIAVLSIIHLFSKNMFEPKGWREFLEHTWIAFFTIAVSISFMISLKNYVRSVYPRTLWETFLGFPFSLQTLMYFVILLLIGGIFIRLGDLIKLDSSPFKASGITLVLVSMVFLIPQFQIIPLEYFHNLITSGFSILLIFYGLVTAMLLYKDAGLRYLVTNERIVKLNTHKLENSVVYPLYRFKDIGVVQGFLAKRFGYGNVNILFHKASKGRKRYDFCILHGVKKPHLLGNTIQVLAQRKMKVKKKKPQKMKVKKKKPQKKKVKKKKLRKKTKKPKTEDSKKHFYYRVSIPLIVLCVLILMISPPHTAENGGIEDPLIVEENHELTFKNLTQHHMNSTFEIHQAEVEEEDLSADEIRQLYHSNEEIKEVIEEDLTSLTDSFVESRLNESFGLDGESYEGEYSYNSSIDEDSLEDTEEGPIVITSYIVINFYPTRYDVPENADLESLLYSTLKIGGRLEQEFPIYCEEGHKTSYNITAPPDLAFIDGEERETSISLGLNNTDGLTPRKENRLEIGHENPVELKEKQPDVSLLLDIYELKRDVDREYVSAHAELSGTIDEIPVPRALERDLPEPLDIKHINADFLKLLYDNGFEDEIDRFLAEKEDEINYRLTSVSGKTIEERLIVRGIEGEYEVNAMDSGQPLNIFYNASFEKDLSDGNEQTAFEIQRRYLIDQQVMLELGSIQEWGLNYTIKVPEGMELMDAEANGRGFDIQEDETGRYYIEGRVDPDSGATISMTVGTYIDVYSFLPFVIIIAVLFFTWIGINMYSIKKRRTRHK